MNKKVSFFCQVFGWRFLAYSVFMLTFFPGFLYGMSTHGYINSQRIERARERAEHDAIARGKTGLEVRSAGRAAAIQEMDQIRVEWQRLQAHQQGSGKKEKEKEEEKEPENPVPAQRASAPASITPEEQVAQSREELKWAARWQDQKEQFFRMPARFDDGPALRFGDYIVAWDEEQRRNRVLMCSSPKQCNLETEDAIYIYKLEGAQWVLYEALDK